MTCCAKSCTRGIMTGTVAIIDYGSGNLRSAAKAFERVIADTKLGLSVIVTDNPAVISDASYLVLPGQGAFFDCMAGLRARTGIVEALNKKVLQQKTPFLGICVGMQLLANQGHEYGLHEGLGWIAGEVIKIKPQNAALKIPHMGWNTISIINQNHPVMQHISQKDHFYFVHSFMFELKGGDTLLATAEYGGEITAIVADDNIVGVQFHPEKSQDAGLRLIRGFLEWDQSASKAKEL